MRAEQVRGLTAQAQTAAGNLQTARGAFALRPQRNAGTQEAQGLLRNEARRLVRSRNAAESVVADVADAEAQVDDERQRAQAEVATASQSVQAAQREEDSAGLTQVGGGTSAGITARRRAQAAEAAAQSLAQQAQDLAGARVPLEEQVRQASDPVALFGELQGDQRDAAAAAVETAERQEGPPRRKASAARIGAGAAIGGALGLGLGGLLGGGLGALAGTFLGSTALGAMIGAGAGALLGGAIGSLAGAATAATKGRRRLPGRTAGSLHDEGTFEVVDGATDRALAPERLQRLNAAAPPRVPLDESFLDATEPAPPNARAARDSLAAGAVAGRAGTVASSHGFMPSIDEGEDADFHDGVGLAPGMISQPHSRSATPASLPSLDQDDEGEAAAQAQDAADRRAEAEQQQRQQALEAQRLLSMQDEEGGAAGSGAMVTSAALQAQAAGPQMSPEELEMFEQGLAFKQSGREADSMTGVPATAQAMFGTDRLNAVQSHMLQVRRLEVAGHGDLARLAAGPAHHASMDRPEPPSGRRRRGRKVRERVIGDDILDAPDAAEGLTPSRQPVSPPPAPPISPNRQEIASQPTAPPEPRQSGPSTPSERAPRSTGLLGSLFSSARNFVGERLLGSGVISEFNGWSRQDDDSVTGK